MTKTLVLADRPLIALGVTRWLERWVPDAAPVAALDPSALTVSSLSPVPRVTVLDVDLPTLEYQRLCLGLREAGSSVVCLVGGADDGLDLLVARADAIVTGAQGLEGVASAVRTVLEGHTYVPPALLGGVLHGLIKQQRAAERRRLDALSAREEEVLTLLGEGRDVPEIARELCISPETTKTHIRHVLGKLDVRSRIEAAAVAAEAGLVRRASNR